MYKNKNKSIKNLSMKKYKLKISLRYIKPHCEIYSTVRNKPNLSETKLQLQYVVTLRSVKLKIQEIKMQLQ